MPAFDPLWWRPLTEARLPAEIVDLFVARRVVSAPHVVSILHAWSEDQCRAELGMGLAQARGLIFPRLQALLPVPIEQLPWLNASFDIPPATLRPAEHPAAEYQQWGGRLTALDAELTRTDDAGLSARVLLTRHATPIKDQKNLGSCTGFAGVGHREYWLRGLELSAFFQWRLAKHLEPGTYDGDGTRLLYVCQGLSRYGAVTEELCPYRTEVGDFRVQDYFSQTRWKINGFASILLSDMSRVPDLMKRILAGKVGVLAGPQPFMIGVAVHEGWGNGTLSTRVSSPCLAGTASLVATRWPSTDTSQRNIL